MLTTSKDIKPGAPEQYVVTEQPIVVPIRTIIDVHAASSCNNVCICSRGGHHVC
jgi:hypothetical protein